MFTIEIWNELGKLKTIDTTSLEEDIDVSELTDGFYILRLLNNNQLIDSSKFIIQKK